MNTIRKAALPFFVTAAISTASGPGPAVGVTIAKPTTCSFQGMTLRVDPGLTAQERPSKFRQTDTGTVICDGPVRGRTVTGPGVFVAAFGSASGSCAGGKGVFTDEFSFPTKTGTLKLTNSGPFTFGPLKGGIVGGELDGDTMTGTFSVSRVQGNCVTTPLTELTLSGKGTLR